MRHWLRHSNLTIRRPLGWFCLYLVVVPVRVPSFGLYYRKLHFVHLLHSARLSFNLDVARLLRVQLELVGLSCIFDGQGCKLRCIFLPVRVMVAKCIRGPSIYDVRSGWEGGVFPHIFPSWHLPQRAELKYSPKMDFYATPSLFLLQ